MCGIAGILQFGSGTRVAGASALVARMNNAQRHRGPDAGGLWSSDDDLCHLGHRRLSIIDLSEAANQPMLDGGGRFVMVFNGEIYNYKQIKSDLQSQGVQFKTQSDSEVLLQGFIAKGAGFFATLDGMFAVAIYDTLTRVLTLARDAAGEKPLYYVANAGFFAFASELRPLLAIPQVDARLSERSLAMYMALRYVPAPYSILENVHKLPPASILQVGPDGAAKVARYFDFSAPGEAPSADINLGAFAEEVEAALITSLRDRLNSDVPLGAFLSSGVDSSLACALLTQKLGKSLTTFSMGFSGDPQSEHGAAAEIARSLQTNHHEFILGASDFDDVCNNIGGFLDEPNGDRSCVPTYLLSRLAREFVTVAISGDGGDELFGGYGRYTQFIQRCGKTAWPSAGTITRTYLESFLPVFPWQGIQEVAPHGFSAVTDFAETYGPIFAQPQRTLMDALRMLDFETYLPGAVLPKVDRMSMRHGLEVRTPFLNGTLYALSRRSPYQALVGPEGQKAVLRRLVAKYLPSSHSSAPKKGFGMPPSVFLNNKERVKTALSQARDVLAETNFFKDRPNSATKMCSLAGGNINAIWATIVLAKWIESVGANI